VRFRPVETLDVALAFEPGAEIPVGRLACNGHRILFEFARSFLDDPLPISPIMLRPAPGVLDEPRHRFEGLFGVFDDSLPDGWGRLLLDREMDRLGVGRERLTPLDRLAFVGEQGAGALVYRPAYEAGNEPGDVDLHGLAEGALRVLSGEAGDVLRELLALGGSSGGARPKVRVDWHPEAGTLVAGRWMPDEGFLPLLVKFGNVEDPVDAGAVEHAYAAMARAAGIEVAPTWLLGARDDHPGFFATRRFDRPGHGRRLHLHSLCGVVHADHRFPSTDYETLLKATRLLTADQRAVEQVFRRMVFNVLAHNRDDHSRNFAFLMDSAGQWRPSPAYDLTFSHGPGGEHWMTLAGEGRQPGWEHVSSVARDTGVGDRSACDIVGEVRDAVGRWTDHAEGAGVSPGSAARILAVLESCGRMVCP